VLKDITSSGEFASDRSTLRGDETPVEVIIPFMSELRRRIKEKGW